MDKDKKESFITSLTTEKIKTRFKSQFDLVGYAIRLAENMIRTGREPRVKDDVQNKAMLILAEISQGKDQFDEIVPEQENNDSFRDHHHHHSREPAAMRERHGALRGHQPG